MLNDVVFPSRRYKPCTNLPFRITNDPFVTFRTLPLAFHVCPYLSNIPREIEFLFKSGTCLTSFSVLMVLSASLNSTAPIPTTLQALLSPKRTWPPLHSSYEQNQFFSGHMWNEHPESNIHFGFIFTSETHMTSMLSYPSAATSASPF